MRPVLVEATDRKGWGTPTAANGEHKLRQKNFDIIQLQLLAKMDA